MKICQNEGAVDGQDKPIPNVVKDYEMDFYIYCPYYDDAGLASTSHKLRDITKDSTFYMGYWGCKGIY